MIYPVPLEHRVDVDIYVFFINRHIKTRRNKFLKYNAFACGVNYSGDRSNVNDYQTAKPSVGR